MAIGCLQDGWDDGTLTAQTVFPNWYRVNVMSGGLWLFDGVAGPAVIQGLTVCNFGTASTSDLAGVYVVFNCGATTSGTLALTYAGAYNEDTGTLPAWTWSGATPDFSGCPDLCGTPPCGAAFAVNIYVDVASCPAAGTTLRMGFPTNNGFTVGSITDNGGCQAPIGDAMGPVFPIAYLQKSGPTTAAPGDTITFTIYYGRPGSGSLSSIQILDTLPPYTHYVTGTASPALVPGWDPDPGPPSRLLWNFSGPFPTTGGPTGMVTFAATVDWGNGEFFEPGSGDVAAPEGTRLSNRASGTFVGAVCSYADSAPAQTVVRRFLMWMIGDNDLLFSPSMGQAPDEMVYDVFVKNLSPTKTWWDVVMWDTVPAVLDPWCANCGFDDPCSGWTMTPSGCAAASPGRTVVAGSTILTWKLDMPPGSTVVVRWKAQVNPTTTAGSTAVNMLSMQERGRTGIVGGTGNSVFPSNFGHVAPIILPVTYISYVAFVASTKGHEKPSLTTFFPLNRKTQFELRALHHVADAYAIGGGVSPSIGCLVGDCVGGFPGSGGACPVLPIPSGPGSLAGCKAERIPAAFDTVLTSGYPFQDLYKVTSNAPVAWMIVQDVGGQCSDYHMYAPASSLSYTGLIHYGWRIGYGATPGSANGTSWVFMNTGKTPSGAVDTSLPTTVHLFKFNYTTLAWDYRVTYDLAGESLATDLGTTLADEGAYRSVSSQSQLIVYHGYHTMSTLGCGCPCYNLNTFMPTRETGNTVGLAGQTFYGSTCGSCNPPRGAVGNVGPADAMYRVSVYVPDSTAGNAAIPVNLRGTSGSWLLKGTHVVPTGLLAALNPRIYPDDGALFDNPGTSAYKVEVLSGGPIQVHAGIKLNSGYGGGAVMHAADGNQTGVEFWTHQTADYAGTTGASPQLYSVNVFAPKTGMVIRLDTDDGRTETYTTTGPDQSVAFIDFSEPARKRNIRVTRLATGAPGNVIAEWNSANKENPGITAPFLQTGVHYAIIMPPVVYIGQAFWITVIVLEQAGDTKTDYCGTTSFTSTDPAAKIEGGGMQAYDYVWKSNVGAGCGIAPFNDGIKVFINVSFSRIGLQSIIAVDTVDGSISGVSAAMVVGADVKLSKGPKLSVAASGDTVRFQVCWSNYSSTSAFSFVITDAVPVGTTFLPEAGTAAFDCGNTRGQAVTTSYSTSTSATPPAGFTDGNPIANTRWLRWTIPFAGVNTTGCACYRISVN